MALHTGFFKKSGYRGTLLGVVKGQIRNFTKFRSQNKTSITKL